MLGYLLAVQAMCLSSMWHGFESRSQYQVEVFDNMEIYGAVADVVYALDWKSREGGSTPPGSTKVK